MKRFSISNDLSFPRGNVNITGSRLEIEDTPEGVILTIYQEVERNEHHAQRIASFNFKETFFKTFSRWLEYPSGELRLSGKGSSLIWFVYEEDRDSITVYIDGYPFFDGFEIRDISVGYSLDTTAVKDLRGWVLSFHE